MGPRIRQKFGQSHRTIQISSPPSTGIITLACEETMKTEAMRCNENEVDRAKG
jgi:hypothetical protein